MKTDRELIAEFDGWQPRGKAVFGIPWWEKDGRSVVKIEDLYYETNFNMLMPVVEKIRSMVQSSELRCYTIYNGKKRAVITQGNIFMTWNGEGDELIEAIYGAVLEFVKWYNIKNAAK